MAPRKNKDPELHALETIRALLEALEPPVRARVLDWAEGRFRPRWEVPVPVPVEPPASLAKPPASLARRSAFPPEYGQDVCSECNTPIARYSLSGMCRPCERKAERALASQAATAP